MITTNRICKFARKTQEYKLTYSLVFQMLDGEDVSAGKDDVEHITKLFKVHCSTMDTDHTFIVNA